MDSKNEIVRALLTKAKTLELDVMLDRSVRIKSDSIVASEDEAVTILGMDALEPVTDASIQGSMDFFYDLLSQTWYQATGGGAPNSSLKESLQKLIPNTTSQYIPQPYLQDVASPLIDQANNAFQAVWDYVQSRFEQVKTDIKENKEAITENDKTPIELHTALTALLNKATGHEIARLQIMISQSAYSLRRMYFAELLVKEVYLLRTYIDKTAKGLEKILETEIKKDVTVEQVIEALNQSDTWLLQQHHAVLSGIVNSEIDIHSDIMGDLDKALDLAASCRSAVGIVFQRIEDLDRRIQYYEKTIKENIQIVEQKIHLIDQYNAAYGIKYDELENIKKDLAKFQQTVQELDKKSLSINDKKTLDIRLQELFSKSVMFITDILKVDDKSKSDFMSKDEKCNIIAKMFRINDSNLNDVVNAAINSNNESALLEFTKLALEIVESQYKVWVFKHPEHIPLLDSLRLNESLQNNVFKDEFRNDFDKEIATFRKTIKITYIPSLFRSLKVTFICKHIEKAPNFDKDKAALLINEAVLIDWNKTQHKRKPWMQLKELPTASQPVTTDQPESVVSSAPAASQPVTTDQPGRTSQTSERSAAEAAANRAEIDQHPLLSRGGTGINTILYNPFLQKFINNAHDSYIIITDKPKLYHNTKNGVDELWAVLNSKYVVIVSNEPKTKPTINFGEFVSDNGKTKLKKHTMITKEVSEMIWV